MSKARPGAVDGKESVPVESISSGSRHSELQKALKRLPFTADLPTIPAKWAPKPSQIECFTYQRLPSQTSFRILELLPGAYADPIKYNLLTADWNGPPCYDAVSYTWGDPSIRKVRTICNDSVLEISPNLAAAMRQLRYTSSSRLLWTDAACIDQSHLEERGHQVDHMREIYRNAEHVIVWLGNDEEGKAAFAYEVMKRIADAVCKNSGIEIKDLKPLETMWELLDGVSPEKLSFGEREWEGLYEAFRLGWFARLWVGRLLQSYFPVVLQEVVAAREVVVRWGALELNWDILGLAATFVRSFFYHAAAGWEYSYHFNMFLMREKEFHSLKSAGQFLHWGRRFKVTDPLDRVYGMIGFSAFHSGGFELSADYSLDTVELYTRVAAQMVKSTGFEILPFVSHMDRIEPNFPSWVPRWDRKRARRQIDWGEDRVAFPFIAGMCKSVDAEVDLEKRTLKARGVFVDTVDWFKGIDDVDRWFDLDDKHKKYPMLDLYRSANIGGIESVNKVPSFDLLACSFVSAARWWDFDCETCTAMELLRCDLASYLIWCSARLSEDPESTAELAQYTTACSHNGEHTYFRAGAHSNCLHRGFFQTSLGYFGVGSNLIQEGDVMAVLFGGNLVYILRPREEGGYEYIGECYVHALMQGEALMMLEEGKYEETVFEIY